MAAAASLPGEHANEVNDRNLSLSLGRDLAYVVLFGGERPVDGAARCRGGEHRNLLQTVRARSDDQKRRWENKGDDLFQQLSRTDLGIQIGTKNNVFHQRFTIESGPNIAVAKVWVKRSFFVKTSFKRKT